MSDLDGTLLRSDGTLSPATTGMLTSLRDRGVPLVVATGRTPRAVQRIAGHRHLGMVVCANGAVVWDAGASEVVEQRCFPAEALRGTRVPVSVVVDCLAAGMTDAEIHEQYPSLPADAARAAVAYGAMLAREELHPMKPTSR